MWGFRVFALQAKTHWLFVISDFLNKARGPDAIQAKTHGASEKNCWAHRGDVKIKMTSKTCLTGVLRPSVFYNFRLEHVGMYFASFLIETLGGKVLKAKRPWAFPFQAKTREGF